MNIKIQKTISEYPKQKQGLLLAFFNNPALIGCLFIFLLLLACESYYKNTIAHERGTTYIGGVCSVLGFALLIGAVSNAYKKRNAFQKFIPPTEQYYVTMNDEGFERGVKDFWSEKKSWRLLTNFDERANAFWLYFGQTQIPVFKYEFEQPAEIEEFREFLKSWSSAAKK